MAKYTVCYCLCRMFLSSVFVSFFGSCLICLSDRCFCSLNFVNLFDVSSCIFFLYEYFEYVDRVYASFLRILTEEDH